MTYTATYSPEDNKLRLYASSRLDKEIYDRVKAAGFKWAPKQELFVAPMWTPSREDLLIELAGEIEDEDKSLVERQEERAERFSDYSDNRKADADRAHAAVHAIADNIPLGQPILVGHHSEKHARRDAAKIENGMRKAVKMWEQSKYWTDRAAGAIRHAKYKERPDVRYRRIKGLEADLRREQKSRQMADAYLKLWLACSREEDKELQRKVALRLAGDGHCSFVMRKKEGDRPDWSQRCSAYEALTGNYPTLYAPRTIEEVLEAALSPNVYPRMMVNAERWIAHLENRIAYERAMIDDGGGLAGEAFDYQPGGRVLRRGSWYPILKVNNRGGVFQSVTVGGHFASTISADEIKDYRPPEEGEAEKMKEATKTPPLCNYPGEGFLHMTEAEYKGKNCYRWSDFPKTTIQAATDTTARHRVRQTRKPAGEPWSSVPVYLTDKKITEPPPFKEAPAVSFKKELTEPAFPPIIRDTSPEDPDAAKFEALKETVKAGVQVVSAPQLFPTPPELARRMVEEAAIDPRHPCRLLEPSAGTGAIIDALPDTVTVYAVEINNALCRRLNTMPMVFRVTESDFLECSPSEEFGQFDRILMNPPFANGDDIKHITHALKFLKPGGRLVAICANGPRQNEKLKPIIEASGCWEDLPAGTFESSGTGVNTALLVYDAPEDTVCPDGPTCPEPECKQMREQLSLL